MESLTFKILVVSLVVLLACLVALVFWYAYRSGKRMRQLKREHAEAEQLLAMMEQKSGQERRLIDLLKSRALSLAALLIVAHGAFAQVAQIKLKDSTTVVGKIIATSSSQLFTAKASIAYENVVSVSYDAFKKSDASMYQRLVGHGVQVFIGGRAYSPEFAMQPEPTESTDPIDGLYTALAAYDAQRNVGKGMQFVALVGTAVAMGVLLEGKKPVKPGVFYGLAAVGGLGIIVDIDAGRKLRMRKTGGR